MLWYFQDILNHFHREFVNPCSIWHLYREAKLYMGGVLGEMETRQGSVTCHGCIIDKWQS